MIDDVRCIITISFTCLFFLEKSYVQKILVKMCRIENWRAVLNNSYFESKLQLIHKCYQV
jgi:hypothetical protein